MEHVMGVGMCMRVPRMHVRVHLMNVGISRSALGSQAIVPRVSETRMWGQAGLRKVVAAPDASVCRVKSCGVGEVRVRGGDTRTGLR